MKPVCERKREGRLQQRDVNKKQVTGSRTVTAVECKYKQKNVEGRGKASKDFFLLKE